MDFQWDVDKARNNRKKHGVEFADAVAVFEDEMALNIEDPDAVGERRFVTVGRDTTGQLLTVVYTLRGREIRIIPARPATRQERKDYEEEI
jgi:hypothetical protein